MLEVTDIHTGRAIPAADLRPAGDDTWIGPAPAGSVPRYGIVKLHCGPRGQLAAQLVAWSDTVRLSSNPREQWGIDVSYSAMRRALRAGFVVHGEFPPGCLQVSVGSMAEFIAAWRRPDFWTPARLKAWRDAEEKEPLNGKRSTGRPAKKAARKAAKFPKPGLN